MGVQRYSWVVVLYLLMYVGAPHAGDAEEDFLDIDTLAATIFMGTGGMVGPGDGQGAWQEEGPFSGQAASDVPIPPGAQVSPSGQEAPYAPTPFFAPAGPDALGASSAPGHPFLLSRARPRLADPVGPALLSRRAPPLMPDDYVDPAGDLQTLSNEWKDFFGGPAPTTHTAPLPAVCGRGDPTLAQFSWEGTPLQAPYDGLAPHGLAPQGFVPQGPGTPVWRPADVVMTALPYSPSTQREAPGKMRGKDLRESHGRRSTKALREAHNAAECVRRKERKAKLAFLKDFCHRAGHEDLALRYATALAEGEADPQIATFEAQVAGLKNKREREKLTKTETRALHNLLEKTRRRRANIAGLMKLFRALVKEGKFEGYVLNTEEVTQGGEDVQKQMAEMSMDNHGDHDWA